MRVYIEVSPDKILLTWARTAPHTLPGPAPEPNDTERGLPSLPSERDHAARLSGIGLSLADIIRRLERMEKRDVENMAIEANALWRGYRAR